MMVELALQWMVSQQQVDSVLLGARTPEHLESNLKAIQGRLDQDTREACDEICEQVRGPYF